MADETTPKAPKKAPADAAEAAPKAKKEKPPALEDKPFTDFIQQDYLPALKASMVKQGVADLDLRFEKRKIEIRGFTQLPECWQVMGQWGQAQNQPRQFSIYFFDESLTGQKGFSCSETGSLPSTLESFRIDERKVDLGSLVFWTVQRLNAQKWLVRN